MGRSRSLAMALIVSAGLVVAACGGGATPIPPPEDVSRGVSFVTEDGLTLQGRIFGTGDEGVVLAHMYPADQRSWWDFAGVLAEEGYTALTFNFRGYGTVGEDRSEGSKEIELIPLDLQAAMDFLRSQGPDTLFLVGASMGGTASLQAAAGDAAGVAQRVAGVISLSSPVEFQGLDLSKVRVQVPVLLMATEGDSQAARNVDIMVQDGIVEQVGGEVVYGESNDHGTDILDGPHGEAARARMLEFLRASGS